MKRDERMHHTINADGRMVGHNYPPTSTTPIPLHTTGVVMSDAEVTPKRKTPAELASAVLDAIEAQPDAFNMNDWARLPGYGSLPPEKAPECGSQLCAAAWTAHFDGWTLVSLDQTEAWVTVVEDGEECVMHATVYAERGDERRLIGEVAAEALGVKPSEAPWYDEAPTALKWLREIAGR
ncbi:hypothetical protein ACFVY1_26135 [Streptomyces sp. NPDC058293]|uniref:hypothetical protein n=1 Tax=Streptomyces sp. NPDC058293 TaxID=3346429 RepID=UPI0036ED1626